MSAPMESFVWLLTVGSGMALALLVVFVIAVAGASLPTVGLSRVMLECPHCGAETPANDAECHACHRSFREETLRVRPVIDAPKLR